MKALRRRMLNRAFPASVETAYRARLNQVLNEITNSVLSAIREPMQKDYISDGFGDYVGDILQSLLERWTGVRFQRFAEMIARVFVSNAKAFSDRTFSTDAAKSVGINAYDSERIQGVINIATKQNAQLITSIASQHLDAISQIVYSNVMAGNRPSAIEKAIQEYGVTKRRAKLIARDQTAKVLSTISRAKMQDAGFKYFQWDTSHDSRVRPSHREVQNRKTPYGVGVYRWDDLPIVDGEKTSPGMPIQCRCVALPVADFEVYEYLKRKK